MPHRRNGIYVILILCLVAGIITGRTFFLNIAYMLGALLFLSFFISAASVSGVFIGRRTSSKRAQVGKVLDEQFSVQNRSIFPKLWLEVRDHSSVPGHSASAVAPPLLPGRKFDWRVQTICMVRGEFTLGPITLVSGDPFGLFQSTREIGATSTILVYPAVVPVYSFAPPTGILSGGDAQRQRSPFVTTNAAGVRDYAPGDSYNRIHWRSSARRDQIMVKEFELDPIADVWLFLDLSASASYERPYTTDGLREGEFFIPPSSLEYAIVVASSLAEYFLIKERELGFATYNPSRFVIPPDQSHRQITRILETLAMARSDGGVTCEQLIAFESHHMDRGAMAVIITADQTEGWIREANLLVRRGLRVVVVLLDPPSFGATEVRSADETCKLLDASGVITYVLKQDDNITAVLSR
ncbi:MAG TPA: DUF58 domain-containing protein [Aggregatilineales bacterium]|nr:DUF58 domain-containing protein [Aggregatilineales bacterium]